MLHNGSEFGSIIQASLVKDPAVSVNRIIWNPDGSLFGKFVKTISFYVAPYWYVYKNEEFFVFGFLYMNILQIKSDC